MKTLLYTLIAAALFSACSTTSKTVAPPPDLWTQFNYDITCEQVGRQGTQSLIISSIVANQDEGIANARKHAVHAILFKGVSSGPCTVPALVSRDEYEANKDYFMNMFNSFMYERFIASASDTPRDVIYVGRNVKVSSNVNVQRNDLRSQLVKDGVIKSLNNVF
jgi:hypothetical protein